MDEIAEINSSRNVFTESITEPQDNKLMVILCVGVESDEKIDIPVGNSLIKDVSPINRGDLMYEVLFNSYACYYVLNESYFGKYQGYDDEVWEYGNNFRKTKKSKFIDYFETLGNDKDYVGDYYHYQINTWTHVVDVISAEEPRLRKFLKQ